MRGFFRVILIGILFLPSIALTHPGKTDRRGGHACRKDCSEWDLYVGEYHLHEEDFHPVRTEGTVRPKTTPNPENNTGTSDVKAPESALVPVNNLPDTIAEEKKTALPIPQPVPENRTTTAQMIPEPNSFSPDQLWLLLTALGLIFLLSVLIARRKKTGG